MIATITPQYASISEWHIILVLVIVFLLFGGKKLPELARGIGQAIKEFKKAQKEISSDDTAAPKPPVEPPPEAPKAAAPQPKPAEPKST